MRGVLHGRLGFVIVVTRGFNSCAMHMQRYHIVLVTTRIALFFCDRGLAK